MFMAQMTSQHEFYDLFRNLLMDLMLNLYDVINTHLNLYVNTFSTFGVGRIKQS